MRLASSDRRSVDPLAAGVWTATGGTISSDGLFTSDSEGTFKVTRKHRGQHDSDTTVVIVTSAGSVGGCSAHPYTRRVEVGSTAQLSAALNDARAGDLIVLGDATYTGHFTVTTPGTASQRITLCGTRNAKLTGGEVSGGGFALTIQASYWTLDGFTVTNTQQGVRLERSRYGIIRDLAIHTVGQDALNLRAFSKHNLVEGNTISNTGLTVAAAGEGIHVGTAPSKWSTVTGGKPDQTDSNTVRGNTIGPDVRSELIDAKEGTAFNRIEGNTFDARGQVWNPATHWVDSWVEINGDDYYVADNKGSGGIRIGFQTYKGPNGWGNRTRYERNVIDLSAATQPDRYGIYLSKSPTDVVVKCDNSATGGVLSNVACSATAAKLDSLTVSPDSVVLVSQERKSFTAKGWFSDGTTGTVAASWSASGGAIDGRGTYTAGTASGRYRVIGTHESGRADTATVAVTATQASGPVRLTLTPATISLQAGGTQQFTVKGILEDGSQVDIVARYTGAGGSIRSTGLYTAGQTAGTYRVVASDTMGTLSDTAVVTITAAEPPPAGSCARTVNVATMAQLDAAVEVNARPGDCIHMADGIYQGSSSVYLRMTVSGTPDQPIRLIGSRNAILDGGGVAVGGFHVQLNASYWVLDGFTVRNRMQGVQLSGARHSIVRNLEIYNTGQEALSLWMQSKRNLVEGNRIHDTGKRVAEYGEGIYLGMAPSKWGSLNGGRPDRTDSNTVRANIIGPNVTSELLDAKEGTAWNRIEGNTFDARGQIWNSATHWVDSWVEINGDDYVVVDNRGSGGLRIAFQTYKGPNGWGNRTHYEGNVIDLSTATQPDRYGIYLSKEPSGVVVKCDNSARGAMLSNVSCR